MKKPRYSVVIPLYNEEKAFPAIGGVADHFSGRGFEVIFVNNGSWDGTGKIIEGLRGRDVRTVHIGKNEGMGNGILAGMKAARGEFVGFTMGGGQVRPELIEKVFREARDGAVCKAKRLSRESAFRKLASFGYNLLANALFFVRTTDINGHPLVVSKKEFDSMGIWSKDFMINLEIIAKARERGMGIVQVRIPYQKRMGGKSHVKLSTVLLIYGQLISFRKRYSSLGKKGLG